MHLLDYLHSKKIKFEQKYLVSSNLLKVHMKNKQCMINKFDLYMYNIITYIIGFLFYFVSSFSKSRQCTLLILPIITRGKTKYRNLEIVMECVVDMK